MQKPQATIKILDMKSMLKKKHFSVPLLPTNSCFIEVVSSVVGEIRPEWLQKIWGFSLSDGSQTGLRQPKPQLLLVDSSMSKAVYGCPASLTSYYCQFMQFWWWISFRQTETLERAMLHLSNATGTVS